MKNTRSIKPIKSPARVLRTQDLERVIGGEGTPMPAIWGGVSIDGTPLPWRRAPLPDGTPMPA